MDQIHSLSDENIEKVKTPSFTKICRLYVYVQYYIPSIEMKILELESGIISSGKVPSIDKLFVFFPTTTERNSLM